MIGPFGDVFDMFMTDPPAHQLSRIPPLRPEQHVRFKWFVNDRYDVYRDRVDSIRTAGRKIMGPDACAVTYCLLRTDQIHIPVLRMEPVLSGPAYIRETLINKPIELRG